MGYPRIGIAPGLKGGANLSGARTLSMAHASRTLFLGSSLADTKGLDSAKHRGRTRRSCGRLAVDFMSWVRDTAKFEAQLDRVVSALRLDDQAREKVPPPQR